MTEYALVVDGVVVQVIVADSDFVSTQPGNWVLTPYNPETGEGKVGKGWTYDGHDFAEPE